MPYGDKYYMYGSRVGTPDPAVQFSWGEQTGFDVYISTDLENWSEAKSVFKKQEAEDGGHGMLFNDFDANLNFVMHIPNDATFERPVIKRVFDNDGALSV